MAGRLRGFLLLPFSDDVIKYINNQEEHHKTKSFKEEYLGILQKLDIQYNEDYLFEWIE